MTFAWLLLAFSLGEIFGALTAYGAASRVYPVCQRSADVLRSNLKTAFGFGAFAVVVVIAGLLGL